MITLTATNLIAIALGVSILNLAARSKALLALVNGLAALGFALLWIAARG